MWSEPIFGKFLNFWELSGETGRYETMKLPLLYKSTPTYGLVFWMTQATRVAKQKLGRFSGQLTTELEPTTPGLPLSGVATVSARRELGPGKVVASLVCTERRRVEDHLVPGQTKNFKGAGIHHTNYHEVYRHDVVLADELTVSAGGEYTLPFTIPTPDVETLSVTDGETTYRVKRPLAQQVDRIISEKYNWGIELRFDTSPLGLLEKTTVSLEYDMSQTLASSPAAAPAVEPPASPWLSPGPV